MKPELTLLVCAVGLAFLQIVVAALLAAPQVGMPALLGNRDDMINSEADVLPFLRSMAVFTQLVSSLTNLLLQTGGNFTTSRHPSLLLGR